MTEETVELGINNSPPPGKPEGPKCTKCVDATDGRLKPRYRRDLSVYIVSYIFFSAVPTIIVTMLLFKEAPPAYATAAVFSLFLALNLLIPFAPTRQWVVGCNLYVGYEKETGQCHIHTQPLPKFLEKRVDLPNGEQTVERTQWLKDFVLQLPLGGWFRRPKILQSYGSDHFYKASHGPFWSLVPGSHGFNGVRIRNQFGDVVVLHRDSIFRPPNTEHPHIQLFMDSVIRTKHAEEAYHELVGHRQTLVTMKTELAELRDKAVDKMIALLSVEKQRDHFGWAIVTAIDQLKQSKGERKSRPAELAREWLEAQLVGMPTDLVKKWKAPQDEYSSSFSGQQI